MEKSFTAISVNGTLHFSSQRWLHRFYCRYWNLMLKNFLLYVLTVHAIISHWSTLCLFCKQKDRGGLVMFVLSGIGHLTHAIVKRK